MNTVPRTTLLNPDGKCPQLDEYACPSRGSGSGPYTMSNRSCAGERKCRPLADDPIVKYKSNDH